MTAWLDRARRNIRPHRHRHADVGTDEKWTSFSLRYAPVAEPQIGISKRIALLDRCRHWPICGFAETTLAKAVPAGNESILVIQP